MTRQKSTFKSKKTSITKDAGDQDPLNKSVSKKSPNIGSTHNRASEEVKMHFQKTSPDDSPTIARNYIKNGDRSPQTKKAHTLLMKGQEKDSFKRRGTMLASAALPHLNYE